MLNKPGKLAGMVAHGETVAPLGWSEVRCTEAEGVSAGMSSCELSRPTAERRGCHGVGVVIEESGN